jgi:hypothetical protein
MKDLLTIAAVLIAWIALNRWILPALGVPTCMSGACSGGACQPQVQAPAPNIGDLRPVTPEAGGEGEQDKSLEP